MRSSAQRVRDTGSKIFKKKVGMMGSDREMGICFLSIELVRNIEVRVEVET